MRRSVPAPSICYRYAIYDPDPSHAYHDLGNSHDGSNGLHNVASTSHDPVAIQLITPNEMRAQATSIFFVASVLPGIALGATSVAMLTDLIFKDDYSIRYSRCRGWSDDDDGYNHSGIWH